MALKHVGKVLIVAIMVLVGTLLVGHYYDWPHSKEPITMGFDEEWRMGSSELEVGTVGGSCRIIPLLDFEYNGVNYTTYGDAGLPANPVFLDKKDVLISADGGRNFQKFYTKKDGDTIYTLYAVVKDNNVYYVTEELYSEDHYRFTLEQKGDKATISYHPDVLSFAFNWLALGFIVGIIAFLLILFYINRNEIA